MTLTQERLHKLLDYDPETGIFRWKVNRRRKAMAGTVAGTTCADEEAHAAYVAGAALHYGEFARG